MTTSQKITDTYVDIAFVNLGFALSLAFSTAIAGSVAGPLGTVLGALAGLSVGLVIWAFQTFCPQIYSGIKVAFHSFVMNTIPSMWHSFTNFFTTFLK